MTDTVYTLQQAIDDGVLVEVFRNRWQELSGSKPIVATSHIYEELTLAAIGEIWNEYVHWLREVRETLPEEEQLFSTTMNGETVWVIEGGAAHTIMFSVDY